MDDYYETLQVSPKAGQEVIQAAYRCLALKCHPDRHSGGGSSEKAMKRLNEAWGVLGDPSARSAYDRKRKEGEGNTWNPVSEESAFAKSHSADVVIHALSLRLAKQCQNVAQDCIWNGGWSGIDRDFYALIRAGIDEYARSRHCRNA